MCMASFRSPCAPASGPLESGPADSPVARARRPPRGTLRPLSLSNRAGSEYDHLSSLCQLAEGSILARAQLDGPALPIVTGSPPGDLQFCGDDHLVGDKSAVRPLDQHLPTFVQGQARNLNPESDRQAESFYVLLEILR